MADGATQAISRIQVRVLRPVYRLRQTAASRVGALLLRQPATGRCIRLSRREGLVWAVSG